MGQLVVMHCWHDIGVLMYSLQQPMHTSGSEQLPAVLTGLQSFVNAPYDAHSETSNAAIIVPYPDLDVQRGPATRRI